jgi:FkbM family methyltransferase
MRCLATTCEKYLRAYHNEGHYDLQTNGEEKIIDSVLSYLKNKDSVVVDVGANEGEWSQVVVDKCRDTRILCFEIIPTTAETLRQKFSDMLGIQVFGIGLSSISGKIDVYWNKTAHDTSSIAPLYTDPVYAMAIVEKITCQVKSGDDMINQVNIDHIDLLKIDVEGHEVDVLKGFNDTLASAARRPSVIQFEYGVTYIPAHHSLLEIYALLTPRGYTIGRLYPDGVDFKEYALGDDHFRMGNYIAVQKGSDFQRILRKF